MQIFIRTIMLVCFTLMSSTIAYADPIVTDSTSNSTVTTKGTTTTTVKSAPPSAISPSINSNNSDLCTIGVSGAVQTQILGISGGATVRDMNCERLKLAKTIYDMGMYSVPWKWQELLVLLWVKLVKRLKNLGTQHQS